MFESMKAFTIWFISQLPSFLMAEPICYFVGIFILVWILKVIFNITNRSY